MMVDVGVVVVVAAVGGLLNKVHANVNNLPQSHMEYMNIRKHTHVYTYSSGV